MVADVGILKGRSLTLCAGQTSCELPANFAQVKRTIKLVTEQKNIDKPSEVEGFPMKIWNIEVFVVDQDGNDQPATCFQKVTYNLHPSFKNPVQSEYLHQRSSIWEIGILLTAIAAFNAPPFRCENEGWGEFDMTIDLYTTEKGGKTTIPHDLSFQVAKWEKKHVVPFRNPSQALLNILRETGPVPGEENGARKKDGGNVKRPKKTGSIDMEKLAEGLVKLGEDDLLHVVQMIHDNKSDETYTKNDIERMYSGFWMSGVKGIV